MNITTYKNRMQGIKENGTLIGNAIAPHALMADGCTRDTDARFSHLTFTETGVTLHFSGDGHPAPDYARVSFPYSAVWDRNTSMDTKNQFMAYPFIDHLSHPSPRLTLTVSKGGETLLTLKLSGSKSLNADEVESVRGAIQDFNDGYITFLTETLNSTVELVRYCGKKKSILENGYEYCVEMAEQSD